MTDQKSISDLPQNNLTIEDVRSIPDFSNFNDEKLQVMVESIKELTFLLYSVQQRV